MSSRGRYLRARAQRAPAPPRLADVEAEVLGVQAAIERAFLRAWNRHNPLGWHGDTARPAAPARTTTADELGLTAGGES